VELIALAVPNPEGKADLSRLGALPVRVVVGFPPGDGT